MLIKIYLPILEFIYSLVASKLYCLSMEILSCHEMLSTVPDCFTVHVEYLLLPFCAL